jgi:acyl-CoA dehydrogenase
VRCVLLTGSGRGFCSGGDVEDIIGKLFGRSAEQLLEFTKMTCDVVANMRRCRRPIVAAVNGTAAGAGAVLAAASDIRFAADSARIAFLFVKVGLSGADMGISWLLPRLVGQGNASELLFTGDFISAQRAHEMGLYQRVLPAERLLPEARAFAEQLARGPADALAVSKRALALESHMTLEGSARPRGARAGRADDAPRLPRGVRGVPRQAQPDVSVNGPDLSPIRAFLDERHVALAASLAAFAERELRPRPEPVDDGEARREARALLAAMGQAGVFGSLAAMDWRGCCLAREALAAASPLADAVFALQGLGLVPILVSGNAAMRERWLAPTLEGRAMAAFAMTEPEAGSDVASLTTRARRVPAGAPAGAPGAAGSGSGSGEHYVLDGAKCFISNAGIADYYTTFATLDPAAGSRGICCVVVPADTPGLRFVRPQILSAPHPLGEIAFEGCRVPVANRLGEEGKGFALGLKTLDRLRATVGAAACGMAARALAEALAHARTRRQFGKPLGEFQLVQEKLARMATHLTAARLLVYRAAHAADAGAERVTLEAAMAKLHATETAQRIVDDAVQVLGGKGVLASSVVDRLYRSVRALRIYEGTSEVQHLVIAGLLLKEDGQ